MNEKITIENLAQGYGIAYDWFGGKVKFILEELSQMIADFNVKKIYANLDGKTIRREK